MEEKKIYEQVWFAWVVLILFAPVGIVLMWKYKHHGVIGRTLASVVFGCLFIVVVAEQVGIKDKASGAEAAGEGATETVEDGKNEDDEGSLDESSGATNDEQTGDNQSDDQTESGTDGEDEEDGKDLVEVVLDEKISITDDQVTIKGKTNLEDGAILSYIVTHLENEDELVRGELTVKDGKFKVKKDISHFANGEIYAYLVFRPEKQDETIQETYGEQGQYMIGDKVTADNDDEDVNIVAAESLYEKVKPIVREGTGDQATKPFELSSGFAVFEADHQGGSNFIVHLLDENGDKKDFLINEIGTYKGKTLALIPADGKYLLKR
ncbi:hypothetical protein [Numidum massiliense]|uniref:hypothetical protein n=1 Tax=Numidum massiliense TaxID=1522315 RepID=UPI0006D5AAA1|nr:hypothetical protein [Numidum massiliense]